MTTTARAAKAAAALAKALTRARIPARAVECPSDRHSTQIHLTISGEPHTLYLDPEADTVVWELDSEHAIVSAGTWPLTRTWWRRPHHHTIRHLRTWLTQRSAILGHPAPRPIENVIGREVDSWDSPFPQAAAAVAEALTTGTIKPSPDEDALIPALAALYPELTEEYGLLGPDGWDAGIGLIHALAHGWIADLSSSEDQRDYEQGWCWTVQGTAPRDVARLRNAFNGDVMAAATAFHARYYTS